MGEDALHLLRPVKAAQGWRLSSLGGRAFGPPLCGRTRPATPPTTTCPTGHAWTLAKSV